MHISVEYVPYGPVHNMSALVSPVQNQAITLFNVDQDLFHHMPSLANWSHYENTPHSLTMSIKLCPIWAFGGNFTISWQEGHHCNKIVFSVNHLVFLQKPYETMNALKSYFAGWAQVTTILHSAIYWNFSSFKYLVINWNFAQ